MVNMDLLGSSNEQPLKIIRPDEHEKDSYTNLSTQFKEHKADYRKQYCKIYAVRLEKMFELLHDRILRKWGSKYPIIKVHKLQQVTSEKCIIIGTLFKDQKLKPSILKKISERNSLIPQPVYTHFTDESDQLYIEDDLQRFQLLGNVDTQKLVTGISCALLGSDQGKGKFLVEDYCFVECRPQIDRPLNVPERFVCFISGLDLINYEKVLMPLKLCVDYLSGFLSDDVSKICRLIVAGNSVRTESEPKLEMKMETTAVVSNEVLEAVKKVDLILSQFARFMDVDVMPGQYDPSNHLLAQQPMHKCMFPISSSFERFRTVTNPYSFEVDGVRILGSSGQPVTDVMNYSKIESPIEALEQCLIWSHISPTSPDTLACYPYYENDPFIIEEAPHVFFAGNQPSFQTKIHQGNEDQNVRLLCVPEFSKSAQIILLNLNNLECYDMNFETHDI